MEAIMMNVIGVDFGNGFTKTSKNNIIFKSSYMVGFDSDLNKDAIKIELDGEKYTVGVDLPSGTQFIREDFIKVLSIKLGNIKRYEIIKTYDLVRYNSLTNSTSVYRDLTSSTFNKQYCDYIVNELNPVPTPTPIPTPTPTPTPTQVPTEKKYTIFKMLLQEVF